MNPSPPRLSDPPRICLLSGSFHPVVGGGERHARLLCRELTRRRVSIFVVTRRRTRALPRREVLDGVSILRVPPSGYPRLGKYLMLGPALHQLWLRRNDYDLIYVCGLRVLGVAGMIAQRLLSKPCILRAEARGEFSGEFIWHTAEGRRKPLLKFLFRPMITLRNGVFKKAAGFLSVGTPIRDELIDGGVPPEKIASIPNGLDPGAFHPSTPSRRETLRREWDLSGATVYAYAGKLNRGKGLEMLLRVWRRFTQSHSKVRLLLIGSGAGQHLSCEEALRAFTKTHKLEDSVIFTGYVDGVPEYLNASDVFVFPSESESQGLAVLEAMACKLPVIASQIPGIMDMIEDGVTGKLVPPRDETAWFRALTDFDPNAEATLRQAETAAALVRERFDIAAVSRRHVAYFRKIHEEF